MSELPAPISQLTSPLLFGTATNWLLFGALTVQTYNYYVHFRKDRIGIQIMVYGLYIWEAVQTALVGYWSSMVLAQGWGDPSVFAEDTVAWFALPFMNGIISTVVQCFFAWRIYVLSASKVLAIGIATISLASGIAAIITGLGMRLTSLDILLHSYNWVHIAVVVWLITSAVCDVVIFICMSAWYWRTRRTGLVNSRTEDILVKIVRLSIVTGSITSAMAILDSVFFLVFPLNNYHFAPAMIAGKMYTNTLLVFLNERRHVHGNDFTQRYTYEADTRGSGTRNNNGLTNFAVKHSTTRTREEQVDQPIAVNIFTERTIDTDNTTKRAYPESERSNHAAEDTKLGDLRYPDDSGSA